MINDSPFRAGFGKTPPMFVGREDILDSFRVAVEVGSWSQERALLVTGFRGVGKTVTLNKLEDIARGASWSVISETATEGFVDRLTNDHLRREIDRLDPPITRRITGGGIAPITLVTEVIENPVPAPTLRSQIRHLTELLEPSGRGLLITIDEVNESSGSDIQSLATGIQHAIREDAEVAIVLAGLQIGIGNLLREESLTFLRRASRFELDLLSYDETLTALRGPIQGAGRTINDEALDYAARASRGYPFLVQLIGDLAWKANPAVTEISVIDAQKAFRKAHRTMGSNVHEPSIRDLSDTDRTVLAAMAADDGPSIVAQVRDRLGVNPGYFSMYRQRLIDAGVIYSVSRGTIDFAVPYLREYLKEHIVTDAVTDRGRARARFPPPPPLP